MWVVGIPFFHGVVPWWISLLGTRRSWVEGRPGTWNLVGLIPILAGAACLAWILALHFEKAPEGWAIEATPRYLLTRGPYSYSRNPIYVTYGPIWLGWAAFYGSVALLLPWLLLPMVQVLVLREERALEARFGDTFRQYKETVPRWIGRPRRAQVPRTQV